MNGHTYGLDEIVDTIIESLEDDPAVFRVDEEADDTLTVELIDGAVFRVVVSESDDVGVKNDDKDDDE